MFFYLSVKNCSHTQHLFIKATEISWNGDLRFNVYVHKACKYDFGRGGGQNNLSNLSLKQIIRKSVFHLKKKRNLQMQCLHIWRDKIWIIFMLMRPNHTWNWIGKNLIFCSIRFFFFFNKTVLFSFWTKINKCGFHYFQTQTTQWLYISISKNKGIILFKGT